MEIRTVHNEKDLRLKNDAFQMPGRFIPALQDGVWAWRAEYWDAPQEMCFPDEPYTLEYIKDGFALGAYEGNTCIGLAIYKPHYFKYLYLEDLKVCAPYRGTGAGRALIESALPMAKEMGYRGIWATAQDNNLNACLFYLKCGFQIGGFDNKVYEGTSQAGKGNVEFYLG